MKDRGRLGPAPRLPCPMAARIVFKICDRTAWDDAVARGAYDGSNADRRDGFIHLSDPFQVEETAARHFSGQHDLALDASRLAPAITCFPRGSLKNGEGKRCRDPRSW